MHLDFDSFFASVEQQDHKELRGKPIGVTGSSLSKGVICAASREAKKFGVKTAMPVFKAKKLCPQIITVRGSFERYQKIHNKTKEILTEYTDLIEPFSIDEFFIDMTKTLKFFGTAEEMIFKLKEQFFNEFGAYITASLGVAHNKLMAKLSSDINKPNGFFIVTPENIQPLLERTPLTDFCGIGPRINKRLHKIGVTNIEKLQKIPPETLYREFGNLMSIFLKNLSFGIDDTPVRHQEFKELPKSIGHQHTLNKNTKDIEIIKRNIQRLSNMVGKRLRRNDMVGKTIGLYLRNSNFKGAFERETLRIATDSSQEIYETGEKLLKKLQKNEKIRGKDIRLVGVSISNLKLKALTPLPLFEEDRKKERIFETMDLINDKFGEFTIIPANTLLADKTKGKISSFLRH